MEENLAKSVFLIHDVLEKPFARRLAIALSLAGATVWLDEAETGQLRNTLIGNIGKEILGDIYLAIILSPIRPVPTASSVKSSLR